MEVQQVLAKSEFISDNILNRNFFIFWIENVSISRNFKLCSRSKYPGKVSKITFYDCEFLEFPRAQILLDFISNLTSLTLISCNIKQILPLNLYGLEALNELYIGFNAIEMLSYGLFEFTTRLEIVSFCSNQIKEIDADILRPLQQLKYFNLENNPAINVKYDAINNTGNVSFVQLKEAIKQLDPKEKLRVQTQNEIEVIKTQVCDLTKKIEKLTMDNDNLNRENVVIKNENVELKKGFNLLTARFEELRHDIEKLKAVENSFMRNFVVLINGEDFEVDKELLMNNSPVFAKLIRENADTDRLELENISSETFEDIINFMQTKNPPNNAANLIELFTASARLEMKELMDSMAEILMEKVTFDNAMDIIKLCKKYGYDQLNKKAYDELFKNYPK